LIYRIAFAEQFARGGTNLLVPLTWALASLPFWCRAVLLLLLLLLAPAPARFRVENGRLLLSNIGVPGLGTATLDIGDVLAVRSDARLIVGKRSSYNVWGAVDSRLADPGSGRRFGRTSWRGAEPDACGLGHIGKNRAKTMQTHRSETLRAIKLHEEDMLREAMQQLPIVGALQAFLELYRPDYADALRRSLAQGEELSPSSHPLVHELLGEALGRLGLSCNARIFQTPGASGSDNAGIWNAGDDVLLTLERGLLTTIDNKEVLQSIIGHELGSFGFGHLADPLHGLALVRDHRGALETGGRLDRDSRDLLALLASREADEAVETWYVLRQLCELNADRAGLIAQPDLHANLQGEILLSAGHTDRYGRHDTQSFLAQGRELIAQGDLDELLPETRPIAPLRAIAMEYFWRSDRFREITGHGPGEVRLEDFTHLLSRLVPLHFVPKGLWRVASSRKLPAFLLQDSELQTQPAAPPALPAWVEVEPVATKEAASMSMTELDRGRLAFYLAERVVTADNQLSKGERRFLLRLVRPRALADSILDEYERLHADEFLAQGSTLLSQGRALDTRTKAALVRIMIEAVKSDRKIEDDEIRLVAALAHGLDAERVGRLELENAFGSRVAEALGSR